MLPKGETWQDACAVYYFDDIGQNSRQEVASSFVDRAAEAVGLLQHQQKYSTHLDLPHHMAAEIDHDA